MGHLRDGQPRASDRATIGQVDERDAPLRTVVRTDDFSIDQSRQALRTILDERARFVRPFIYRGKPGTISTATTGACRRKLPLRTGTGRQQCAGIARERGDGQRRVLAGGAVDDIELNVPRQRGRIKRLVRAVEHPAPTAPGAAKTNPTHNHHARRHVVDDEVRQLFAAIDIRAIRIIQLRDIDLDGSAFACCRRTNGSTDQRRCRGVTQRGNAAGNRKTVGGCCPDGIRQRPVDRRIRHPVLEGKSCRAGIVIDPACVEILRLRGIKLIVASVGRELGDLLRSGSVEIEPVVIAFQRTGRNPYPGQRFVGITVLWLKREINPGQRAVFDQCGACHDGRFGRGGNFQFDLLPTALVSIAVIFRRDRADLKLERAAPVVLENELCIVECRKIRCRPDTLATTTPNKLHAFDVHPRRNALDEKGVGFGTIGIHASIKLGDCTGKRNAVRTGTAIQSTLGSGGQISRRYTHRIGNTMHVDLKLRRHRNARRTTIRLNRPGLDLERDVLITVGGRREQELGRLAEIADRQAVRAITFQRQRLVGTTVVERCPAGNAGDFHRHRFRSIRGDRVDPERDRLVFLHHRRLNGQGDLIGNRVDDKSQRRLARNLGIGLGGIAWCIVVIIDRHRRDLDRKGSGHVFWRNESDRVERRARHIDRRCTVPGTGNGIATFRPGKLRTKQ